MTRNQPHKDKDSESPPADSSYQDPYKIGPSTYVFSFSSQYPDQRENLKTVKTIVDDTNKSHKTVKPD